MSDERVTPDTQKPELPPELVLPTIAEGDGWSSGRGCGSLGWWVCAGGIAGLVVVLVVGYHSMRQTVWAGYHAAEQRMRDSLPRRLPGGELQRVRWNLDRWDAHLEQSDDPYPDIGAFMSLARDVFEDRMVTAEEVGRVNAFIEERIGPEDDGGGAGP